MAGDHGGSTRLDLQKDGGRLLAMLSVAYRRSVPFDVLGHLKAASDHWQRGDKALANLRLVFANLPRLDDPLDACRLHVAEHLLDSGMLPSVLMRELGMDATAVDLAKYDPDQPRVLAGNGRESGRWTSDGDSAFLAPVAAAARSFLSGASADVVASLEAFAARFSIPTAVLGALFIPTPNSGGVTEGTLPDAPNIAFQKDGPAGTLSLTVKAADGSDVAVVAENRGGIYVDVRTGKPIGREFGNQFYLDLDSVHTAIDTALERDGKEPEHRLDAATDEPKLCPPAMPDVPHWSSKQALDYEDDVHLRVNPTDPIPRGYGVRLVDPLTGKLVYYDDCFRYAGDLVDGDMHPGAMAEAKSKAAFFLSGQFGSKPIDDFAGQAEKEWRAAAARGVGLKYYFAEQSAADLATKIFRARKLDRIAVSYMPPRSRK
jgi:hypothetical protein